MVSTGLEYLYLCDQNIVGGGIDYSSGPYTITFPAGERRARFKVSLTDDNILEGNENFVLTINSSSLLSRITPGNLSQATVTIVDNECK